MQNLQKPILFAAYFLVLFGISSADNQENGDSSAISDLLSAVKMKAASGLGLENVPDFKLFETEEEGNSTHDHVGVHLASWRWDELGVLVTIVLFIIFSGLAKVAFHHLHFISSRIPESCLLVVVGIGMGAIIKAVEPDDPTDDDFVFPTFTPDLFFYFLLPPIILEAAYSLYDQAFFGNIWTILLMAVVGTALNFVMIGLLLFGMYKAGAMGTIEGPFTEDQDLPEEEYDLKLVEVMTYTSLISAVDPVAVLAIFQEVGVNPDLYFLLFGESLLNDGVAVVLYNMMNAFAEIVSTGEEVSGGDIALGLVSFFTIAFGGLTVGIIVGLLTALVTKTTTEVRVVEPLAMFGMAYMAYLTAELFHWSGIISLIGCGLIQAHYAFKNISKNSYTTIKYFISMLSSTSDCIIFLFLGIAIIEGPYYWHTGFAIWTIVFTLVCRFIVTYGLTFLANRNRLKKINVRDTFIMAYGGLRGAVAFSLVEMIDPRVVPPQQMFQTTTLAVVIFTIFIQGGTIKALVNLLNIDKKREEQRLISEEVYESFFEHLTSGIEVISGKRGRGYLGKLLQHYDEKYLMKFFCIEERNKDIINLLEELAISDHLLNLYGPQVLLDEEENKTDLIMRTLNVGTAAEKAILEQSSNYPPSIHGKRSRSVSVVSSLMKGADSDASGVRRRRKSSKMDDRTALHDALVNSPYHKYHMRYNPNLINDEDQELESQLRRRHSVARKISSIAAASGYDESSLVGSDVSPAPVARSNSLSPNMGGMVERTRHISLVHPQHLPQFEAQLNRVPVPDRAGVEAIISRHEDNVRRKSQASMNRPAATDVPGNIPTPPSPPPTPAKPPVVKTNSAPKRSRKISELVHELDKVEEEKKSTDSEGSSDAGDTKKGN